jgi:hypothetical protein
MDFVVETLTGLGTLLLKVFAIVVPLMMVLEISREFRILDKMTAAVFPLARRLGYKRDSIYPLVAGVIFGISYGGGILIGESNSGRISAKQAFLIAIFLGMCHAIIEDTLLFVAQGANGLVIISVRLLLAFIVVFVASILIGEKAD